MVRLNKSNKFSAKNNFKKLILWSSNYQFPFSACSVVGLIHLGRLTQGEKDTRKSRLVKNYHEERSAITTKNWDSCRFLTMIERGKLRIESWKMNPIGSPCLRVILLDAMMVEAEIVRLTTQYDLLHNRPHACGTILQCYSSHLFLYSACSACIRLLGTKVTSSLVPTRHEPEI